MSRLGEFFEELRDHWDDHYWWADHQLFLAALVGIVAGTIQLLFTWLEVKIKAT